MDNLTAKHRLAEINGPAFAEIAAQNPLILLPLGSHEDHGPLLPMGDHLLADRLAGQIAAVAATRNVLAYVAPCLPFGVADYFGCTPGGLAISAASFRAVLADLLASLLRHGLTRIVILNGHGGNVPVIHEVTLAVRRDHQIIIPSFYLWKIAKELMARRLGEEESVRFGHGAEPLLSLSLALREATSNGPAPQAPSGALLLGLRTSGFGVLDFNGIPIDAPVEFDQVPRDAIQAGAPLASLALGAAVATELVETAVDFLVHLVNEAGAAPKITRSESPGDPGGVPLPARR